MFSAVLLLASRKSDSGPTVSGGEPVIQTLIPSRAAIGQREMDIVIQASNLGDVTQVVFADDIQVDSFQGISPSEIQVRLSVSEEASPGSRMVAVETVNGAAVLENGFTILENRAPPARFRMEPPTGSLQTTITLDASALRDPDGRIVSYQWNFGDGETASGKKKIHRYTSL